MYPSGPILLGELIVISMPSRSVVLRGASNLDRSGRSQRGRQGALLSHCMIGMLHCRAVGHIPGRAATFISLSYMSVFHTISIRSLRAEQPRSSVTIVHPYVSYLIKSNPQYCPQPRPSSPRPSSSSLHSSSPSRRTNRLPLLHLVVRKQVDGLPILVRGSNCGESLMVLGMATC